LRQTLESRALAYKESVRPWPYLDDITQGYFSLVQRMIILTKINKALIAVNADLIQYIEETPDTVVTMTNSEKIVVLDSMAEIIQKVVHYRRLLNGLIDSEYERQLRHI